jgi:hypothetical protein
MHGMIATNLVVFDSLVFGIMVLIEFQQELVQVVQRRAWLLNLSAEVLREHPLVEVVLR